MRDKIWFGRVLEEDILEIRPALLLEVNGMKEQFNGPGSSPAHSLVGPHLDSLSTVQLGSHVKVEIEFLCSSPRVNALSFLALVEVDDILNLFTVTSFNDPVVSIEGLPRTPESIPSGSGT